MTDSTAADELWAMIEDYVSLLRKELAERWAQWSLDLSQPEVFEAVAALMARQVTLATQLARAPSIWNAHVAPLILRTMTDTHITFAWIWMDPPERARKFILYGLGQEKLNVEHLKLAGSERQDDVNFQGLIEAREGWLNSQRFAWLTEVDVGSWSGMDARKMAEEAGCLDLYRFAYAPFSAATHSMWQHVGRLNLEWCTNPLHGYHRVPCDPDFGSDVDYLYRAAKYVDKTFRLFDSYVGSSVNGQSGLELLLSRMEELFPLPATDAEDVLSAQENGPSTHENGPSMQR